jgi:hypothetical protein
MGVPGPGRLVARRASGVSVLTAASIVSIVSVVVRAAAALGFVGSHDGDRHDW